MNFININQILVYNDIMLAPIGESDRLFINDMFNDSEIKRYYIVPKEAQQDYRKLVDYWLNDIKNAAGVCWIILQKDNAFFPKHNKIGFVAFEFRDSLKNARISYAILPEYRRNGFALNSVNIVIERLKQEGIERVEADIDRDNVNSERLVGKLGFTANKRHALIDPDMLLGGDIRMRALWKKELVGFGNEIIIGRIPLNANPEQIITKINIIVEEVNLKGKHPKNLIRYFYLLGRIRFLEGNYEEARQAFGQCNMITMNEGLPEIHENYYWFGKMNEVKGENENAKMYYELALEKFSPNPDYMTYDEIEQEMNKL